MTAASAYRDALRLREVCRVRETPGESGELAWQARWFSGACGREFTTTGGRRAVIADFGEWNREAGPDFVRCTVSIDGRVKRGAIEVDLAASGWEQHGHAVNPDYENVVLHVVVRRPSQVHFPRTAGQREVAQVCLADHAPAEPEWAAAPPARPGPCSGPLRLMSPARLTELLEVAARRRFERKGAALSTMIRARGTDAALYEALAIALGYKANKLPFQLLAQRVPLTIAAKPHGEALLFGLAGFLERPEPPRGPARAETASLWAAWWKRRAGCTAAILPRSSWKLAGIRPANHPLRRLGALAAIARNWRAVRAAIESADPSRLESVLGGLEHPFWSFHTSWTSPRRPAPLALLGKDRIREIFANVALPHALARGLEPDWRAIPCGPPNATERVAAARLFGGGVPSSLPRRLFVQQGLLQVYADFCLGNRSGCAECVFPALVERLTA